MDMRDISDKEIQFNIMMALMKIEGHLSDLLLAKEECCYDLEVSEDATSGTVQ